MRNLKALLQQTKTELQHAKILLKEKTRAVERAEADPARETLELERKTIKAAVKGLQEHRDILKEQAAAGKLH